MTKRSVAKDVLPLFRRRKLVDCFLPTALECHGPYRLTHGILFFLCLPGPDGALDAGNYTRGDPGGILILCTVEVPGKRDQQS